MTRLVALTLALSATLAGAKNPTSRANSPAQGVSAFEITIANGPHAGTYKLSPDNLICMHMKAQKRFSAAYRDADARDPKLVNGAGINVFNPDAAGAKEGQVNVTFGGPDDKKLPGYDVSIPNESKGALTMTKEGKVTALAFEGQTKSGIKLRMTARCADVAEF